MKKLNLIGQKFNELTVLSEVPISMKNNRSCILWNCECTCGKIIQCRTSTLRANEQKSCGCIVSKYGFSIRPGQKFNKLTTVSYDAGFWNCICECGGKTFISTNHLNSGNTQSCGCIRIEKAKENVKQALKKSIKYAPRIGTARRRWKSYCYQDPECTLTFDEWYNLSQQNCNYCGVEPSNTINCFIKKPGAMQKSIDEGNFTHNGIDRVDNSIPHILENCVPCCTTCNYAKIESSVSDFLDRINLLKDEFILPEFKILKLPEKYMLVSIKIAYRHYVKNYDKMEIDLQTFYSISQLPCYYCDTMGSNCYNVYLKDKKASQNARDNAYFYYNGLDRINSSRRHEIDNVVPCCKYCNNAKKNMSLEDFKKWILRIKKYQDMRK